MVEYQMSQRARSCLVIGLVQTTEQRYVLAAALTPRKGSLRGQPVIRAKAEVI